MKMLSEEDQHEITAKHLRGDMGIEIWLIPFSITLSLVAVIIIVMVVLHILRQKRKSNDVKQSYRHANVVDSDEMLTFSTRGGDCSLPNGNINSNNSRDVENASPMQKDTWPPQDYTPLQQSPWSEMPSSNL